MSAYEVRLKGCDDSTTFAMNLSDDEARLLQHAAALSRETSGYSCQPTMTVSPCTDLGVTP